MVISIYGILSRVDPAVGTESKKETSIEIASSRDETELLILFSEFAELPAGIKTNELIMVTERDKPGFKKLLKLFSVDEVIRN